MNGGKMPGQVPPVGRRRRHRRRVADRGRDPAAPRGLSGADAPARAPARLRGGARLADLAAARRAPQPAHPRPVPPDATTTSWPAGSSRTASPAWGSTFPTGGPITRSRACATTCPIAAWCPRPSDGLLVAGRCLSADPIAGNTMRLLVPCLATGQAAGVAAAIAAREGCAPRDVPVEALREELRAQDVYLG